MRAICQEFEREEGEGGRSRGAEGGGRGAVEGSNNHFDRILQLMQQVILKCSSRCIDHKPLALFVYHSYSNMDSLHLR